MATPSLPTVSLTTADVYPSDTSGDRYLHIDSWTHPVTYFVGRNGSGKSRTARAVAQRCGGRLLSTDRLVGIMAFQNYGWGAIPSGYKGVPLGDLDGQRIHMENAIREAGTAAEELSILREQPEVALRVAAFLQRALGRTIELRESAGYLDPYVRIGNTEYSLLRDEGHGLRELVVLLSAAYRSDYGLTVVDEPELHLHPSLARLWISELRAECEKTGRRAIVVTHDPSLLRPMTFDDLSTIWHFQPGRAPTKISTHVLHHHQHRVTASLTQNPTLVSDLVFSPRPVLVEGVTDAAALTTATTRTQAPEVVAQTDFVECGGATEVALWFQISKKLGLDVRAVLDLDALFTPTINQVMTAQRGVEDVLRTTLGLVPATVAEAIKPLTQAANKSAFDKNPKGRAQWLAATDLAGTGHESRVNTLLQASKDAGMWVHKSGTLEAVLGITIKGVPEARKAAGAPGPIDDVVVWCAYVLDPAGELEILVNVAVERVAHGIMEALRARPGGQFDYPIGSTSESDGRLVDVTPLGPGHHRITVKQPEAFRGYWVEFTRETASIKLDLNKPIPAPHSTTTASSIEGEPIGMSEASR
ncbi:AAA family ATPase [Rhodococcus sp. 1.20]